MKDTDFIHSYVLQGRPTKLLLVSQNSACLADAPAVARRQMNLMERLFPLSQTRQVGGRVARRKSGWCVDTGRQDRRRGGRFLSVMVSTRNLVRILTAIVMLGFSGFPAAGRQEQVMHTWEVDRTWAGHMTSPPILVTADDRQYLAYFNAERRLTLAWRRLDEDAWHHRHFPVVTTWATGAHALIALAVDADGMIHLIPYRRGLVESPEAPPNIIYYRSTRRHDPASMVRTLMVSPEEPNPHYPVFLNAADGSLFFECRIGVSGRGNQALYHFDRATGEWHRLATLLDGLGRMSAYGSPRLGPDGRWHCLWMWRNTPDAATNHTLSYMVSPDLRTWRNAAGEELALPVNPDDPRVVVDPSPPGGGMINPLQFLGFDSQQRPVASYHVYAPCGNSAIYNARFEEGGWKRVASHVWDFRWGFGGGGAIVIKIGVDPVTPIGDGRLLQRVWSERDGVQHVILDEATLEPVGVADSSEHSADTPEPRWRRQHGRPEIAFPARPLAVSWLPDRGKPEEPGVRYFIRWEHGPVNAGDRPVPEPWPPAAPLRVFKVGK